MKNFKEIIESLENESTKLQVKNCFKVDYVGIKKRVAMLSLEVERNLNNISDKEEINLYNIAQLEEAFEFLKTLEDNFERTFNEKIDA